MSDTQNDPVASTPTIGRNEPCPCGSQKKYKRCCGVDAAPKLTAPKLPASMMGGGAEGSPQMPFDPSQLDPQMMMQMSQALQRLPKGQMQRLQALMQKAMAGKDISQEAAEFERTLPPDFQQMMANFGGMLPGMGGAGAGMPAMGGMPEMIAPEPEPASPDMSVDAARAIIEKAAKEGKISKEQAEKLLSAAPTDVEYNESGQTEATAGTPTDSNDSGSGFSKLWRRKK